jgi:hypothetical protein
MHVAPDFFGWTSVARRLEVRWQGLPLGVCVPEFSATLHTVAELMVVHLP